MRLRRYMILGFIGLSLVACSSGAETSSGASQSNSVTAIDGPDVHVAGKCAVLDGSDLAELLGNIPLTSADVTEQGCTWVVGNDEGVARYEIRPGLAEADDADDRALRFAGGVLYFNAALSDHIDCVADVAVDGSSEYIQLEITPAETVTSELAPDDGAVCSHALPQVEKIVEGLGWT